MQDEVTAAPTPHKCVPWNKGKLTGAKPPLRPVRQKKTGRPVRFELSEQTR
jgi:hypothetical protein